MTRERDIERVLEAWFEPGPQEMPDRLFDSVIESIDRVPQRRLAWANVRFFDMTPRTRLFALAAAVAVVAVVGFSLLIRRPASTDVGTSPTPSVTAAASAAAALPTDLIGRWMGGPRTVSGISETAGTSLLIETGIVSITQSNQGTDRRLISVASAGGAGPTLDVRSATDEPRGCALGDSGSYEWALSPDSRVLTLSATVDACDVRGNAFAGTWWKMACPDKNTFCLGDVGAGTYASQYFDPFVAPGKSWQPRFGVLTYTVPDGWSNGADWPNEYRISPQDTNRSIEIELYPDPVPHAQGANQCEEMAEPGIERSAVAFGSWLAGLSGFVPTTAQAISVGGLSGVSVDLEVDASWTATCPYSNGSPMVSTVTDLDPGSGLDWNLPAGAKARYILLDVGDGRALLVKIESATKAAFERDLDETMAIVESFVFTR